MAYSKYWLKLWYEILDDPKMGKLSGDQFALWIKLLLMAGELNEGGYLPDFDSIQFRLRPYQTERLEGDMSQLDVLGLINLQEYDDGSMRWHVANFEKRQRAESNKERQQRWRDRQKKRKEPKEKKEDKDKDKDKIDYVTHFVTKRNASVTKRYETEHNDNDNFSELFGMKKQEYNRKVKKVQQLIASWKGRLGCAIPEESDPDYKTHFSDPAIVLLKRFDWHVTSATRELFDFRDLMKSGTWGEDGKKYRPQRLSKIVPHLMDSLDDTRVTKQYKQEFGHDAKVFNPPNV